MEDTLYRYDAVLNQWVPVTNMNRINVGGGTMFTTSGFGSITNNVIEVHLFDSGILAV